MKGMLRILPRIGIRSRKCIATGRKPLKIQRSRNSRMKISHHPEANRSTWIAQICRRILLTFRWGDIPSTPQKCHQKMISTPSIYATGRRNETSSVIRWHILSPQGIIAKNTNNIKSRVWMRDFSICSYYLHFQWLVGLYQIEISRLEPRMKFQIQPDLFRSLSKAGGNVFVLFKVYWL